MADIRVRELRLRHFRSFEAARLTLGDLTVLVGRNGAGKSTLAAACEFLRESLTDSLGNALEKWGGLQGIKQRQSGPSAPYDVAIAVRLEAKEKEFLYGFRLGARRSESGFVVKEEVLAGRTRPIFRRVGDHFVSTHGLPGVAPSLDAESLVLPLISGAHPTLKLILQQISKVRSYSLIPSTLRSDPRIGSSRWLACEGDNAGDVLKSISDPQSKEWLVRHLDRITPGISQIRVLARDGRRRIEFRQKCNGTIHTFDSAAMSDGTLRALGVLLALQQRITPTVVFVDEIEDSLHPAGLSVLMDAIQSCLSRTQVVVTSHSPEALSHPAVTANTVRIIEWKEGVSRIHEVAPKVAQALTPPETVGDLLRTNALWPADRPCAPPEEFFAL